MSVKYAILNGLLWLTVLALPVQCFIDPSAENIASACIVVFSALTLLFYIKWGGAADDQPLSTIALFGFCITTQLGALLVQTAFWTPIRASLFDPLSTFGTLAYYQAIAILVHIAYRFFSVKIPGENGIVRGLLDWAGVYRIPASRVLWCMGFFGLLSFGFSSREGIAARVASGFNFLAWAPFLLPLYMAEMGPAYCNPRRNRLLLGAYAGLVVLLGIALNVRVVMFIGVVTVALLYFLVGLRSRAPLRARAVKQLAVLALGLAALSVPLSDLATAMVFARGVRGKVSPVEMVQRTLSFVTHPALLAAYKKEHAGVSRVAVYDEHYIENPLLARFVETKFHDNSLRFAGALKTEAAKAKLRKVTIDTAWAALPTPILRFLHINVDKEDLNYSIGDYMAYLSRGIPLGGRKTGSMFAQGEAIMGPLFSILYAAICLIVYSLLDLLTLKTASMAPNASGAMSAPGASGLSALAMMTLWSFFYRGVTSDALSNFVVFIIRDFAQTIIIYLIVFTCARMVLRDRSPAFDSPTVPERVQAV